jgi:flavorubredoxin
MPNPTRSDEIAPGIHRLTVVEGAGPRGFTFNSFLVEDERPLLYHIGKRANFALLKGLIEAIVPMDRLRYLAFGHIESDECGALELMLDAAPNSVALTNTRARRTDLDDRGITRLQVMQDGETLSLGKHEVKWLDTPHMPHNWESAVMFETTTRTLFCGDLLTQLGDDPAPVTEDPAILEEAEKMRRMAPYVSNPKGGRPLLEKLAAEKPVLLAAMHGSSFRGDGEALLRAMADSWDQG